MAMRYLILLSMLLLIGLSASAQSIPESGLFREFSRYDDLRKELFKNNDTTYVINFWATWCAPCIREMPYFQRLHEETRTQPVQVVLVSLDMERDLSTKLTRYLTNNSLGPPVLVLTDTDANAWIPQISEDWDGAIPATLIHKDGHTRFHEGEFDSFQSLRELLNNFQNHFD